MGVDKAAYWRSARGLTLIRGWSRDGLEFEEIAGKMDIQPRTLKDWTAKYEEIAAALRERQEIVDYQVEEALLKLALGYNWIETKTEETEKTGIKTTETLKHVPGDTKAQMLWLESRRADKWGDAPKEAVEPTGGAARTLEGLDLDQRQEILRRAAARFAADGTGAGGGNGTAVDGC